MQRLFSGKLRQILHHRYAFCRFAQQQCLLHCGVSAADHNDLLAREKRAVTHRAERNSAADKLLLMRESERAVLRARGNDDRARFVVAALGMYLFYLAVKLHAGHFTHVYLRAERESLLYHLFRKRVARNRIEARVVLYFRGKCHLSAENALFKNQHAFFRAPRVDRSRQTGRARADDYNVIHLFIAPIYNTFIIDKTSPGLPQPPFRPDCGVRPYILHL